MCEESQFLKYNGINIIVTSIYVNDASQRRYLYSWSGPIPEAVEAMVNLPPTFSRPRRGRALKHQALLSVLMLWFAWWIVDRPKARQRRVSFGLCLRHRRRRSMFRWLTLAGLPLGIALALVGIFGDQPDEWDLLAFLPGCFLIFGAFMAMSLNPDPKLSTENARFLWIANAGAPFLARLPRGNI